MQQHVANLALYPSSRNSADWAEVEPSIRNVSFFSACVEDERVLAELQRLVERGLEEGWSMGEFVYNAENRLEELRVYPPEDAGEGFKESLDTINEMNRLRLIFRTHNELAAGYSQFCRDFDPYYLWTYPAWRFLRMDGAKEDQKRPDHVAHEYDVALKTDIQYWLDRNSFDQGGFGNPYGPWGFNSWMYTEPVPRQECVDLGLIQPNERLEVPAELGEWGLGGALRQMGSASAKQLTPEAQKRIAARCLEEGFNVTMNEDENLLQIDPQPGDPLDDLELAAFEAWADEDLSNEYNWDTTL